MPTLESIYRKLLYAYPRRYRRERGLEILTTLMDAAGPGQRLPHWRDVIDLLAGGIRRRCIPPHGWLYPVVSTVVALLIGLSLSGTAGRLVWMASDHELDWNASIALADGIIGTSEQVPNANSPGFYTGLDPIYLDWMAKNGDPLARREGWSGKAPGPGYVQTVYRPSPNLDKFVAHTRARLAKEGWEVGELESRPEGWLFWAGKDIWLIRIAHDRPPIRGGDTVTVHVHRTEPDFVALTAISVLGAGTFSGWLIGTWTLRRYARQTPAVRATFLVIGGPTLLSATYLVLWNIVGSTMLFVQWGWSERNWLFPALVLDEALTYAIITLAGIALCILLAARPVRDMPTSPGTGLKPNTTVGIFAVYVFFLLLLLLLYAGSPPT